MIFASHWLQLPLYLGLIAAQAVYVWHFLLELWHLVEAVFGKQEALQALISNIGYKSDVTLPHLNETVIMLVVLALIDVVMISNLLIMVIVGSYEVQVLMWQTIIHVVFLMSALAIAYTDRLTSSSSHHH